MSRRMLVLIAALMLLGVLMYACCPTPKPSVLYVAFGDSVTDCDASPKYPWYIKQWMGLSDDQLENEGQSGERAEEGLPRLDGIIDCDTYPNADVFLYLEGGNDVIDWVQENDPELLISPKSELYPHKEELNGLLDATQEFIRAAVRSVLFSGRHIIVGTYFHVLPYKSPCPPSPLDFFTAVQAAHVNDYVDLLNERIRLVADQEGVIVADIAETGALYGEYDNFLNCNHPSGEGNEIVAAFFYEAIQALPGTVGIQPRILPLTDAQ